MIVAGKTESRIWMSPRHLWNYYMRAQKKGRPLPIAHVLGHHPGFYLDPSAVKHAVGGKMIIDATRPVSRPFSERINIPAEVMGRIDLKNYITPIDLKQKRN